MTHIEYDGIRRNLDHLAPSDQAALVREVELYARAGCVRRCCRSPWREWT